MTNKRDAALRAAAQRVCDLYLTHETQLSRQFEAIEELADALASPGGEGYPRMTCPDRSAFENTADDESADGPHEIWEALPACHDCAFVSTDVHVVHADSRLVDCVRCGHQGVYLGEPGSPERAPRLRAALAQEEKRDG